MRILRTYINLPPNKGGMENHIFNLSKEQICQGHKVTIFYNSGNHLSDNDVRILKSLKLRTISPNMVGSILFYIAIVVRLMKNKLSFDVLHIHGDWSSLLLIKIIKNLTNSRLVAFSIHDQLKWNDFQSKLSRYLLKNVDLVFSTGYLGAEQIRGKCKCPVIFQPSGIKDNFINSDVEVNEFNSKIITVSNLYPKKNIDLIFDIAKTIRGCEFVIIGDGPEKERLFKKKERDGIENVSILGFLPHRLLKNYLDPRSIFLLTSTEERTPTSIIEAMGMGMPIVCSNAGGIGHFVVNKVNGFVIKDGNAIDYVSKIIQISDDISLHNFFTRNNVEKAKTQLWPTVATRITNKMMSKLSQNNA